MCDDDLLKITEMIDSSDGWRIPDDYIPFKEYPSVACVLSAGCGYRPAIWLSHSAWASCLKVYSSVDEANEEAERKCLELVKRKRK